MELEEQKSSYEQKARESLQRVLEEKMGAEQQLESAQVSSSAEWAAGWASTPPAHLPIPALPSARSGPWLRPSSSVWSGGSGMNPCIKIGATCRAARGSWSSSCRH